MDKAPDVIWVCQDTNRVVPESEVRETGFMECDVRYIRDDSLVRQIGENAVQVTLTKPSTGEGFGVQVGDGKWCNYCHAFTVYHLEGYPNQ